MDKKIEKLSCQMNGQVVKVGEQHRYLGTVIDESFGMPEKAQRICKVEAGK